MRSILTAIIRKLERRLVTTSGCTIMRKNTNEEEEQEYTVVGYEEEVFVVLRN